jgi:hypothetical protein
MIKLTKQQMLEAVSTIYGKLADGKKDDEVIAEMGISAEDYNALKNTMMDFKADEIRTRPIEHVYVDYVLKQAENIKDLTGMISEWQTSKQYNALVGAVRTRSDIYDKLIQVGQECGIIHKQPERKELIAGVVIADMTNMQLKGLITNELRDIGVMMKRYGDRDIKSLTVGKIHHGEALKTATEASDLDEVTPPAIIASSSLPTFKPKFTSDDAKARNTKRHAGRMVNKK